jgi:hypothetical protein
LRAITAYARADRTGDLLRGIARLAHGSCAAITGEDTVERLIERALAAPGGDQRQVIIAPGTIESEAGVAEFESRWLAPAIALLSRHAIGRLDVIADGNRAAAHWSASPAPWWRRLTPRPRPTPFVAPARPQT